MFFSIIPLLFSFALIGTAYTYDLGVFAFLGCLYAMISILFAALELDRIRRNDNARWDALKQEAHHHG